MPGEIPGLVKKHLYVTLLDVNSSNTNFPVKPPISVIHFTTIASV